MSYIFDILPVKQISSMTPDICHMLTGVKITDSVECSKFLVSSLISDENGISDFNSKINSNINNPNCHLIDNILDILTDDNREYYICCGYSINPYKLLTYNDMMRFIDSCNI